jgi:hypothetical protein
MLPMRVADPSPWKFFKMPLLSIVVEVSTETGINPSVKGIKFYLLLGLSLFYKWCKL